MSNLDCYPLPQSARQWILGSPFEESAIEMGRQLTEFGYTGRTIEAYLSGVCHFSHWAEQEKLPVVHVNEAAIERFIRVHIPICRCAPRCQRNVNTTRAALLFWHRVALSRSLVKQVPDTTSQPILNELAAHRQYLTEVRGLQPITCDTRTQHVRDFLLCHFAERPICIDLLTPTDIVKYMMHRTKGWKPGSIKVVCVALSSYLRFKAITGSSTIKLIAALPNVAQWRQAPLPKALSSDEINGLLNAFNLSTAGGRRDYAIARCYVDLGLRTAEVVRLTLEDIDWSQGIVHIRSKGARVDALPLPDETGQAIADYLKHRDNKRATRALFLRLRPPFDSAATADTIRGSIRNAAKRCGLSDRLTGPHKLRHTLAIRLVNSGVSLKEISDLLRHRDLDTTTIYAKVDMDALWNVTCSWPERIS